MWSALSRCLRSASAELFGEHATVDPHDLYRSPVAQLQGSEAYITTDITLARQMHEMKRLGDAWRHAVRERRIELNLGTPARLLPRLGMLEEALDHVRVEWALAVRSAADASAALWIDPDTLVGNNAAFGLYLEQLSIQAGGVTLAIALIDLHVLSAISERAWKKAALLVAGAVLRDKSLSGEEYARLALAARRGELGERPKPAQEGRADWEWPHILALQLDGLEKRAQQLLRGSGVRARAFHRHGSEFAFAFVLDTPAHVLRPRAGASAGAAPSARSAEAGAAGWRGRAAGDGDNGGSSSDDDDDDEGSVASASALGVDDEAWEAWRASPEQRATTSAVERLMRRVVQDASRALLRDLPLELLLPAGMIDVEPICGAMSAWVRGSRVRSGALQDAMSKLEQQRTLARAKRAAAGGAGGARTLGSQGSQGVQKALELFGDRPSAEAVRSDEQWLRSLQCKLLVPRLPRPFPQPLLLRRALKVKLRLTTGEGLVVVAIAKAEHDRESSEHRFAVRRRLPLDEIEGALLGELPTPGRRPEGRARGADAELRTFTVVSADPSGNLAIRCELAEAAGAWVRAINAKLETSALARQHTFGASVELLLPPRAQMARTRNTQLVRL